MPMIKNVQRQVRRVERFDIEFCYEGPGPKAGRDVRDDRTGVPGYRYLRAAADNITVAGWIETRFKASFPGFDVSVLDGDGRVANGRTKLRTLRGSYAAQ